MNKSAVFIDDTFACMQNKHAFKKMYMNEHETVWDESTKSLSS